MGQHQIVPPTHAFLDPNRATAGSVADGGSTVSAPATYDSNDALDAALITEGYTQTECDKMTQNDKVYALRLANDSNTL